MIPETAIGGEAREFPATRWTAILAARDDDAARRRALEDLIAAYWKPLYFYVRRKGLRVEEAKDAVQEFLVHVLEKDFLGRADPQRGRFRGYLKASFDHFLVNRHERQSAQKRGGGARPVPLDFDVAERQSDSAPQDPAAAFDREWAVGVMERSLARLRAEYEGGGRRGPFEVLARFLTPGEAPSHEEAAREAGLGAVAFKAVLHRARVRFRELVREEVAHTVASAEDVEAEIAELVRALRP